MTAGLQVTTALIIAQCVTRMFCFAILATLGCLQYADAQEDK